MQIGEATSWIGFKQNARSINAKVERVPLDFPFSKLGFANYYSAIMDSLKPNTQYVYRVGAGTEWSEWSQFTTAKDTATAFKFVYFGDPQEEIKEHCTRVFREAFRTAPDAEFWTIAGDLTDQPDDAMLEELYYAGGFMFRTVPVVPAPGNHDCVYRLENGKAAINKKGKKDRTNQLSPFWRGQFTLPENGVKGLEESCYYVDYQGLRFVVLNSNDKLQEQATWLDKLLSTNPNTWTVVTFHHPFYSTGRERDDRTTRDAFLSVFDKHHIDLVLMGHDHSYARTHKLVNGTRAAENAPGTVYVTSVSGPKSYTLNPQYGGLMAKMGTNVQLFQVIEIDGGKLSYKSYTATGALYDSFELMKNVGM